MGSFAASAAAPQAATAGMARGAPPIIPPLRLAAEWRLVAFGLLLVAVTLFAPRGLAGLLADGWRRLAGMKVRAGNGDDGDNGDKRGDTP